MLPPLDEVVDRCLLVCHLRSGQGSGVEVVVLLEDMLHNSSRFLHHSNVPGCGAVGQRLLGEAVGCQQLLRNELGCGAGGGTTKAESAAARVATICV
jgi:hypothetical protein